MCVVNCRLVTAQCNSCSNLHELSLLSENAVYKTSDHLVNELITVEYQSMNDKQLRSNFYSFKEF